MSGFGDYLSWEYVIPAFGVALAYGWFIYRSVQVKRAGGLAAHSRAHLDRLFQMPPDTRVTAAWEAVTVPKKSKGQRTMEAAGVAFAAVGGVGIEFVGRKLAVACTTANQVLLRDRESGDVQAYGPNPRPSFVDTGQQGTRRIRQMRWGWEKGAILRIESPGGEPFEVDIPASAVPVLVGWSRGEDVSRLMGPFPLPETL
jgi:hypothetical protein